MSRVRTPRMGPRTTLASDGGLLTAGALVIVGGLVLALGSLPHAPVAVAIVGFVAVVVCAPLAVWRLHARRIDGSSTAGAALGCMAGFVSLWVILPVAGLLGGALARIASLAGSSMSTGDGIAVVGVVAAAVFLGVAIWLDVGAVRDLARSGREHVWLDVARLAATAGYAVYVASVVILVTLKPGAESEATNTGVTTVLLLVMPVASGVFSVTCADLIVRRDRKRSRGRLISGV